MKNKLEKVRRAVAGDMLAQEIPALLSRDGFVARYLPEYVQPYELPSGIRVGLNGRPLARGNRAAQVSKRENIISAAFAIYAETRQAQIDFDAKCNAARTANNQV